MLKFISHQIFIGLTMVCTIAFGGAAAERMEPPHWYVGFEEPTLQLMVYAPNIGNARVEVEGKHVSLIQAQSGDSPNYLFIDLNIGDKAPAQTLTLNFYKGSELVSTKPYTLKARRAGSKDRRGYDTRDVIYLLYPDRFANGDPSNDDNPAMQERGIDRSNMYARHGGDLQGIINHLDYIADMGFTQMWLNPVLENNEPRASYHGYATTDFYKVDPRLGTNEDYFNLSAKAKEKGIGVIKDIILNHGGGGHWWNKDLPFNDWYNYQGQPFQGSNHMRSVNMDPYAADIDKKENEDGWFVSNMPDLNQRNPFMANYIIQNTLWWIEAADLSGLRIDTYPYNNKAFLKAWISRVMQEYPNLSVVGEEWTTNPNIVAYWLKGKKNADGYATETPNMFDFPLQHALVKGLTKEEGWPTGLIELYEAIANDHLYPDPSKLVLFTDNHDMNRIMRDLNGDRNLVKMAVAYTALVPRIPQYQYGVEILGTNEKNGDHGEIRFDFPGGWPSDTKNAFTGAGLTPEEADMQAFVKRLLNWRKSQPLVHGGKFKHFAPAHGVKHYVMMRYSGDNKILFAMNLADEAVPLNWKQLAESFSVGDTGMHVLTGDKITLSEHTKIPARGLLLIDFSQAE